MNTIILGGGCFWCLEAFYQLLHGVDSVVPGYAGGDTVKPTYETVCAGVGNHAEVVKITYDPTVISLNTILDFFFAVHDPTTLNRQGHDTGPQYRSCIYYQTAEEKAVIDEALAHAQTLWPDPIVTEIKQDQPFYEAEDYHHNYFANNPEKAYCQVVINPKLRAIRSTYQDLIKS